jgi:hypothetical protein
MTERLHQALKRLPPELEDEAAAAIEQIRLSGATRTETRGLPPGSGWAAHNAEKIERINSQTEADFVEAEAAQPERLEWT